MTAEDEVIHESADPKETANSPADNMEILRKIEAGEISVEDALEEMNGGAG
jgi:hypothetical protein